MKLRKIMICRFDSVWSLEEEYRQERSQARTGLKLEGSLSGTAIRGPGTRSCQPQEDPRLISGKIDSQ